MSNTSDGPRLPPGFYQDAQGTMRWWDGSGWTEQTQQNASPYGAAPNGGATSPYGNAAPAQEPKQPWYKKKVVWAVAAVIVIIAIATGGGGGTDDGGDPPVASDSAASEQREAESEKAPKAAEPESEAPEPEPEPEPKPEPELTAAQENAIRSAEQYLSYTAFSRSGLIEQLKFEDYSTQDATFAVNSLKVDYNEQAAKSAEDYLSYTSFSRTGLIEQLQFEGYTVEQATYGVNQTGL